MPAGIVTASTGGSGVGGDGAEAGLGVGPFEAAEGLGTVARGAQPHALEPALADAGRGDQSRRDHDVEPVAGGIAEPERHEGVAGAPGVDIQVAGLLGAEQIDRSAEHRGARGGVGRLLGPARRAGRREEQAHGRPGPDQVTQSPHHVIHL